MSRKTKFTPEEKEQAVIDYLEGNKSMTQICGELCISSRTIQDWALIYNKHGIAGFSRKIRNRSYSKEFKMNVVEEYIRGEGSSIDLGIKYDIPSGLLRSWSGCIMPIENLRITIRSRRSIWQKHEEKQHLKNGKKSLITASIIIVTIKIPLQNLMFPIARFIPE